MTAVATLPGVVLITPDRAATVRALAAHLNELVDVLSVGPDTISRDLAWQAMTRTIAAYSHENARSSLWSLIPQLHEAITAHASMRDGMTDPHDLGCLSISEALDLLDRDIDACLWPLLTGLPLTDICTRCQRETSLTSWQPRTTCITHRVAS